MANTRLPDEQKRRDVVDEEIERTIDLSPDSANAIAKSTGEHVTFVIRRLKKRFVLRAGRWVYKHKDEK